jgi:F-type H+-transporting ATPase subunit b
MEVPHWFDATFVAFLALLIFVGLIVWLKVPAMIVGALDTQSQAIAKELADARRLREEAEALKAKYEAQMAQAKAEAAALVAAAQDQAKVVAEETRVAMTDAINRRQKQAEDRIAQAEATAEAQVRAAAADAALAAAEKMLREKIDGAAQSALVSAGVSELKAKFG